MRLLFILNKAFEQDPRTQREMTSLIDKGNAIDVLTFSDPTHPAPAMPGAVFHVFPLHRKRTFRARYALEYTLYLLWASIKALQLFFLRRYHIVQVSLLPEPLFFACLIPKLLGVRVITDWMDLGLELYLTKFPDSRLDPFPRILRLSEWCITHFSDLILIPNVSFESAISKRCPNNGKLRVVMNSAPSSFFIDRRIPAAGAIRLIYSGTISQRNGLPVLLEAYVKARRELPQILLTVLGSPVDTSAERLARKLKNVPGIDYTGHVRYSEVAGYIGYATIGIIPSSDTPFTRINLPTRLFEYGAATLPVICSDLPGIRCYFNDSELLFCKPDDPEALAKCILTLAADLEKQVRLAKALHSRMHEFSWDKEKTEYLDFVRLVASEKAQMVDLMRNSTL